MTRLVPFLAAALLALPAHAEKAYGVGSAALGAGEADVKKRFPAAHCKPLEWKTDAADRRCDDARVVVSGVDGRITFYLKAGAIVAFDFRYDGRETARLAAALKGEWGAPKSESKDAIVRKDKEDRIVTKVLWESGRDRALITSISDRKRAQLEVSRGSFPEEVYRVR